MNSTKIVLSGAGPSAPIIIGRALISSYNPLPAELVGVHCLLSAGAAIAYQVEATGEDPASIANAVWGVTGAAPETASASFPVSVPVTALRVNITSFGSGTLTFYVVQ